MEALTLGSIFARHLGFPGHPAGSLGAEAFASRLKAKNHAFAPEKDDPDDWVERFFAAEQPFEKREAELVAMGASDHAPAVLEVDLDEREYLVVEDDDEIVVVSEMGSLVLQRTPELTSRLKAAELPASSGTPSSVHRDPGDRAYWVGQSGKVSLLDARLVAQALAQAPAPRVEPLARVAAPSRLSVFEPTPRPPSAFPVTYAAKQVRSLAAAAVQGPATQVLVLDRTETKVVGGQTAAFWQRLTGALTEGGRVRENLGRTLAGASAVALGRQTYAVRAGAVTALVQRPVAGLGARGEAAARGSAEVERRARAGSFVPKWARDLFDERPRGRGFWIVPAAEGVASARPEWVERALEQARRWRERARDEARGRLDPPMPKTPVTVLSREAGGQPLVDADRAASRMARGAFDGLGKTGAFEGFSLAALGGRWALGAGRTPLGAGEPSGEPLALSETGATDRAVPEVQARSTAAVLEDSAGQPWPLAGAFPASTLQALYTGLERTAAAEGHRITSVDVAFEPPSRLVSAPTGADGAFVDVRYSAPAVTSVQVQTERLAPAFLAAPFSRGGLRVGGDLSDALDRSVQRNLVTARPAGAPAEGAADAIGHLTLTARSPAASAVMLPAAVATAMAPAAAPARLSALAWLDWAISNAPFAHAKPKDDAVGSVIGDSSREGDSGTLPASGSAGAGQSSTAIGEQRALPDSVQSHVDRAFGSEAGTGRTSGLSEGEAPDLVHPAPDGSAPGEESSFGSLSGSRPGAGAVPLFSATGPTIGAPSALAAGGSGRGPESLVAALPLLQVHLSAHQPAPASAARAAEEGGGEVIVIGVPLYVRMAEARMAPGAAHALADRAPEEVPVALAVADRDAPGSESAFDGRPASVGRQTVALPPGATSSESAGDLAARGAVVAPAAPGLVDSAASGLASPGIFDRGSPGAKTLAAPGAESQVTVAPLRDGSEVPLDARAPEMPVVTPPVSSPAPGVAGGPGTLGETASGQPASPDGRAPGSEFGMVSRAAASRATAVTPAFPQGPGAVGHASALGRPGSIGDRPPAARPGAVPGAPGSKVTVSASRAGAGVPLESRAPEMAVVTPAPSSRAPRALAQGESALAGLGTGDGAGGAEPASRSPGPAASTSFPASGTGSGTTAAVGRGGAPGAVSGSAAALASGSTWARAPSAGGSSFRRRAGGSGVLRFFYPSEPRWWGLTRPQTAAGSTPTVLASASEVPALVSQKRDLPPAPAEGWSPAGLLPSVSSAAATPASSLASPAAFAARGARVNGASAPSAPVGGGSRLSPASNGAAAPDAASGYATIGAKPSAAPLELGSVREKDLAYVAVTPEGEAKLVTKNAAAQLATRSRAGLVEMTVVAGIAPQAPSLEDLATAGHDRPHAKGKQEAPARSGHGKTDALSLQGTIDSLAQRIYHRLKRRLESDRERFGG